MYIKFKFVLFKYTRVPILFLFSSLRNVRVDEVKQPRPVPPRLHAADHPQVVPARALDRPLRHLPSRVRLQEVDDAESVQARLASPPAPDAGRKPAGRPDEAGTRDGEGTTDPTDAGAEPMAAGRRGG